MDNQYASSQRFVMALMQFAAVYFALAVWAIFLSRHPGNIATVWYANALEIAFLLSQPRRCWWRIIGVGAIANLAANAAFGDNLWVSLSFVPANSIEVAIAAWLIARLNRVDDLGDNPRQFLRLLVTGCFVAPVLGATLGAAAIEWNGFASFYRIWPTWYIGSVIGSVSLLPMAIIIYNNDLAAFVRQLNYRISIPVTVAIVSFSVLVLPSSPYPYIFILVPLVVVTLFLSFESVAVLNFLLSNLMVAMIAFGYYQAPADVNGYTLVVYSPILLTLLPPLITSFMLRLARIRQREALDAQTELKLLLDSTAEAIYGLDLQGRCTFCNPACMRMLGYNDSSDLIGKDMHALIHHSNADRSRCANDECPMRPSSVNRESRHLVGEYLWRADDTSFPVECWVHPKVKDGSLVGFVITFLNIADRQEGLNSIEVLSERLHLATQSGGMGIWDWNIKDGSLLWDQRMYELYWIDPNLGENTYVMWRDRVHPDDIAAAEALLLAAVRGEAEYATTFRVCGPNGLVRYVQAAGYVVRNASGEADRVIGLNWDVTPQIETQQALLHAKNEMQLIIDHMPAMIGYWDSDLYNRFANTAYLEWFGSTPELFVGKHLKDVIGEERFLVNLPLVEAALGGETQTFEREIADRQGAVRTLLVSYVPEMNPNGAVQGFYVFVNDITALKQAERAQRETQSRLQSVFDAATEFSIIATDTMGTITVFSPGAERMLQYRAEEVVGKHTPALIHVAEEVQARAQQLSAVAGKPIEGFETFVYAARMGHAESLRWTYVRKDGARLPVQLVVTSIRNADGEITGFLGIAKDIVAEQAAAAALEESNIALQRQFEISQQAKREFETLFAQAPGALILVASDGRILEANQEAHKVFGYDEQGLVGRSIDDLVPKPQRSAHKGLRETYNAMPSNRQMSQERVFSGQRRDGSLFDAEVHLSPIVIGDKPCTLASVRDVTQRKKDEQVLREAVEIAEQATRTKSEFLANMSHEIRTPMNAVLGIAFLLGKSTLTSDQKNYVNMIRSAGQSLLGILNDILDFSKIEAGRMELSPNDFWLEDLCKSLSSIMMVIADKKELELIIDVDAYVPSYIRTDQLRLHQVLVNLVSNAIKFTEQGDVVVSVHQIERKNDAALLQFIVRDTGIGMSDEQLERLFVPFTQADASTTRRFGGTGLGLAISKHLIELMGGRFAVSSEPGVGTTFEFTMPVTVLTPEVERRQHLLLGELSVLLVVNSPAQRNALERLIQAWGWHAEACASGENAIKRVTAKFAEERPYDVVVVDWNLPDNDGQKLLRALRNIIPNGSLPIEIIVNAATRDQIAEQGMENEADGILIKPIVGSTLFDTLHEAVAKRRGGASAIMLDIGREGRPTRLDGVKILLVEDNLLNQTVACGILEQLGASITVAENGQVAVDELRVNEMKYNIILMDVQMPVMDGITATRIIRDDLRVELPIIAMTAGVLPSERQHCVDAGMSGFVAKPIDVDELLQAIHLHVPTTNGNLAAHDVPAMSPSDECVGHLERLMVVAGDDPSRRASILSLIGGMVAKGVKPIKDAQELWRADRWADAARAIHTLRGSCGMIGAKPFTDATVELEQAINAGEAALVDVLFARVEDELVRTFSAVQAWLTMQREDVPFAVELPFDPAKMDRLKHLLASNDMAACDLYSDLRVALKTKFADVNWELIDQAMNELRFADVLAAIDGIDA